MATRAMAKALELYRQFKKEPPIDLERLHKHMKDKGIMREINRVSRFLGLKEPYKEKP